jgi:hypothetical protein
MCLSGYRVILTLILLLAAPLLAQDWLDERERALVLSQQPQTDSVDGSG